MSVPVNYSLTDRQFEEMMEVYEVTNPSKLKSELRDEFDELVEEKIDEK